MATHVIRPPIPSSSRTLSLGMRIGGEVYQSTNPCLPIDSDLVLGIARLERYVLSSCYNSSYLSPQSSINCRSTERERQELTGSALPLPNPLRTLPSLNPGKGLVYIVGSYAYPGIPLLEGCVGSSRKVMGTLVDDLGLSSPSLSLSSGMDVKRMKDEKGRKEGEVDWSKGRGGFIGRVWRWRSGEGL